MSFLSAFKVESYEDIEEGEELTNIKDYSVYKYKTEYEVNDSEGLIKLADLVNSGTSFGGKTIYLTDDISFDKNVENNFTAIGIYNESEYNNKGFSGTFEGNYYTISGINIMKSETEADGDNQSILFNFVNAGTVSNVSLSDCSISARNNVSGIVNHCMNGKIDNCYIDESTAIKGNSNVSGLINFANRTKISSCINDGKIIGKSYLAGLAFIIKNLTTMTECINNSEIKADSDAAGLCSYNNASCIIVSSVNNGAVKAEAGGSAGIALNNSAEINKCYNAGEISGVTSAGGIAGESRDDAEINNCYNLGIVKSQNYSGGIAAQNKTAICRNSYNTGQLAGGNVSGAICGYNESRVQNIINCYYLSTACDKDIGSNSSVEPEVFKKAEDEMKQNETAYLLNSNNQRSRNSESWTRNDEDNEGYPVFSNGYGAVFKITVRNEDRHGSISLAGEDPEKDYLISGTKVSLNVKTDKNYSLDSLIINRIKTANSSGEFMMPAEDSVVSAEFVLFRTCRIFIDTNGGILGEGVTIPSEYTAASPDIILPTAEEITREGYTFAGWYTNFSFTGEPITVIVSGTTGDIKLYAKWDSIS